MGAGAEAIAREARRQQALLAALGRPAQASDAGLSLHGPAPRAARGLAVYRANAGALAERALGAAFTTVQAMVGADDFRQLAREFWRALPPERGDMGEWGDAFPQWLEAHAGLRPWPWLGASAALDLALHRCERAADATLDAASLARLETGDPAALRFILMPGVAVLRSDWPIATIHHAHHSDDSADAFAAVRAALAAPVEARGEAVLVARRGWRAVVHAVDAPTADWMDGIATGIDLGAALARAGEGFDFSAWLARALRESWVKGVAAGAD